MLKNYSKILQDYSNYYSRLQSARGLSGIHTGYLYMEEYGLLPCNRLGTHPLDYIKESRVPRRTETPTETTSHTQSLRGTTPKRRAPYMMLQTGRRVRYSGNPNLYKSVSCVLAHTFEFQVS